MWNDLSAPWKSAFLQSWEAFKNGSIPIGAVIVDKNEKVISVGRNQTMEHEVSNRKTSHAETMCIRNLEVSKYPNVTEYTLYTTLEPCPMCMGTLVMGLIRKVKIAGKDSFCGAIYYTQMDTYIKSKNIDIELWQGEMQDVQFAQQCYFYIKSNNGIPNFLVEGFRKDSPRAVATAEKMYKERYLDRCVDEGVDYGVVYDYIVSLVSRMDVEQQTI